MSSGQIPANARRLNLQPRPLLGNSIPANARRVGNSNSNPNAMNVDGGRRRTGKSRKSSKSHKARRSHSVRRRRN